MRKLILLLCLTGCMRADPVDKIPEIPNVRFNKDIKPIMESICIRCHYYGQADLTLYDNAFRLRKVIRQKVVVYKTMPMGIHMVDSDRALFRDWVDQGARE